MPAPVPSFQSYASLRASLRLTGLKDGSDAEIQLQDAVRASFTLFWREIGRARLEQLKALAHNDAPASEDDMLRLLAEATERDVVRAELLRYFLAVFKEGGNSPLDEWNREGERRLSRNESAAELSALQDRIAAALDVLRGDRALAEAALSLRVDSPVTADVETNGPIGIGSSVFGRNGIFGADLRTGINQ